MNNETKLNLTEKQKSALSAMIKGENVFITGPGGVGKSEIIKQFRKLQTNNVKIGITSTTGISAISIGGTTLHSFLGIGLGKSSYEKMLEEAQKGKKKAKWMTLEILIIDEISMLDPALFDKLERIARGVRDNPLPFGGIQIIASGDFCQLPCVETDNFCYEAKSWDNVFPKSNIFYLTEIIRQSDEVFQNVLNEVRLQNISEKTKEILNERIGVKLNNEFGIEPTMLFPTNADVDYLNESKLNELAEDGREFYSYELEETLLSVSKDALLTAEKFRKNLVVLDKLELCVGAQVMLLVNMHTLGLVNGSRGIIIKFIDNFPLVKFINGQEVVITSNVWECEFNDNVIAKFKQIPLKIAYAFTIHKSQSITLDCVEIDLRNIFACGQAYVALSRVRNIEGLTLKGIEYKKIKCHPKAKLYYKNL